MLNSDSEKRVLKSTLKRRMIELLVSIPFGIGFVTLFFFLNLSPALQLFLAIVCWGAVIALIDLTVWAILKSIKKKNEKKPKKRDPFAD
jgi:ABC-type bacteriocin/lantibiotic exporter with double-glycine peptidase domain